MPIGRRERNKEDKRVRILTAATTLFAERSVADVTTQEIADAADIGAGTLFLYARNKGELLLMVQNAHYAGAYLDGVAAAAAETSPIDAVMAIVAPIVICNRAHVRNGRIYLREMIFGDPGEPHHARALEIANDTELALARALLRTARCDERVAASLSRMVSALLLRNLALAAELSGSVGEILARVRGDLSLLLLPHSVG